MAYFAPYIDGTGLHMPTYEDRLSDLVSAYRSIFGIDAEMSEAVPDYQLLSVFAKALDDTSALVLQAYNSRNPLYASGQALDHGSEKDLVGAGFEGRGEHRRSRGGGEGLSMGAGCEGLRE